MQTSIEWLSEQIRFVFTGKKSAFEVFEQAKEMHKQEIIDAFHFYDDYRDGKIEEKWVSNGEQYYNETFKKD